VGRFLLKALYVRNLSSRTVLEDGTPIKLRISRTVSSADARVGDTVDFEVFIDIAWG
jgi:hypothetical protein